MSYNYDVLLKKLIFNFASAICSAIAINVPVNETQKQDVNDTNLNKEDLNLPLVDLNSSCHDWKCPPVTKEKPFCVKLKYMTKGLMVNTIYIKMISKCELSYISCYKNARAIKIPMKHCSPSKDPSGYIQGNRTKRDVPVEGSGSGDDKTEEGVDDNELGMAKDVIDLIENADKKHKQKPKEGEKEKVSSEKEKESDKEKKSEEKDSPEKDGSAKEASGGNSDNEDANDDEEDNNYKKKQQPRVTVLTNPKNVRKKRAVTNGPRGMLRHKKRLRKRKNVKLMAFKKKLAKSMTKRRIKREVPTEVRKSLNLTSEIYAPKVFNKDVKLDSKEFKKSPVRSKKHSPVPLLPSVEPKAEYELLPGVEKEETEVPPPESKEVKSISVEENEPGKESNYNNIDKQSGEPLDLDKPQGDASVNSRSDEKPKDCPTNCPLNDVMICARCKDGVYRTFNSVCSLKSFNCQYPEEEMELVARDPCILSAPYTKAIIKGNVVEPDDDDKVLRYAWCMEELGRTVPKHKRYDERCASFEPKRVPLNENLLDITSIPFSDEYDNLSDN